MNGWLVVLLLLAPPRGRASCGEVGCGCLGWILLAFGVLLMMMSLSSMGE